jgi:hypothetical protein
MKITKLQLKQIIKEELLELNEDQSSEDLLMQRAAPAYVIMNHRGRFGPEPVYITADEAAALAVRDALLQKVPGGAQRGATHYELQVWNGHAPSPAEKP